MADRIRERDDLISRATREAKRCQRSLERGGDRNFWLKRLERAAQRYETGAAILRAQIGALWWRDRYE